MQGFGAASRLQGLGLPTPTHLSFLFASSSFQLRPPWGLVQPRVTRLRCPGLSSAPYLLFQAEASPRAHLLGSAFPEVLAVPVGSADLSWVAVVPGEIYRDGKGGRLLSQRVSVCWAHLEGGRRRREPEGFVGT